jgi:hypothetical protein
VVSVDATHVVVEVEPLVPPAGTNAEVGGKPIAAVGRWDEEDGTP